MVFWIHIPDAKCEDGWWGHLEWDSVLETVAFVPSCLLREVASTLVRRCERLYGEDEF